MTKQRYWVVGGDYDCVAHRQLKQTPLVEGPFDQRDQAQRAWQRLSREHSPHATTRFSILTEQITVPR